MASLLLIVGMSAVFAILSLVALSSRILILVTNRMAPDLDAKLPPSVSARTDDSHPAPEDIAVIIAAVQWATDGKGYPEQIRSKSPEIKK